MNHKELELLAKAKNSMVQPPATIQAFIRAEVPYESSRNHLVS